MDGGRIVGRGNHDELLESCDAYRNLLTKEELSSSFKSRPSLA
jgi:ABC-type multidrug transport system fused ATPase/permease subunit